ncbi:MAG: hypothetical protein NVSMB47_12260 [Polyangiales bacterium]
MKGAVTIRADGTEQTLSIPVLQPTPAPTVDRSPAAPSPMVSSESVVRPPRDGFGVGRTVGVVVAGAGVASLAVGTYFWSRMRSLESEADGLAAANDSSAFQRADDARTAQRWARITLGAGVVALGAGAVLYLTAPKRGEATALRVTPSVASTWGLSLQGAW